MRVPLALRRFNTPLMQRAWLPALSLVLGGLLQWFPFLRSIDYPLSLIATPTMAVLGAIVGVRGATTGPLSERLAGGLVQVTIASALFVLPAVITSAWTGIVCEPLYGLLFLLMGPLCSAWMGLILGHYMGALLPAGWALALIPLLLLGSVAIAVAEFIWSPGVRFYGTFFGLYHGAVYDEAVFVEKPYLWLRIWNLVGATAIILHLVARERRHRHWWIAGGLATLIWLGLGFAGPNLGFVNSTARLEAALSAQLQTAHFTLRFKPGGRAARWAPLMATDMEFRGQQILHFYGLPEPDKRVTAFLYESPQHKASLMGAGRTSIAKPWLGQIHIHAHGVGGRLVHHELAHALLADASKSFVGMPTNAFGIPRPGILEGAAVAVERGGRALTTHQWARAMRDVEMLPNMPSMLEELAFWTKSSSRAYTACGSFIRYLVENRGSESFLALYGGAGFEEAYAEPLEELLEGWHEYLDDQPLSADDLELARFAFSRPPVFQRQCPYAGGRCFSRARLAAALGEQDRVAGLAAQSLRVTDVDLGLGRRIVRLLLAVGATEETLALLEIMHRRHPDSGLVMAQSLKLVEGDVAWLTDSSDKALERYVSLHQSAFAQMVFPAVEMRLALLAERAPETVRKLALGAVLRAEIPGLLASAEESLPTLGPTARLQVIKTMATIPAHHSRAGQLCTAQFFEALPRELRYEALWVALRLATMNGELGRAKATVAALQEHKGRVASQALLEDWGARIRWLKKVGGKAYSQAGSETSTSAEAGSASTRTD